MGIVVSGIAEVSMNKIALDIIVSVKFPPREVTFLVSGVFQQGQFLLTWMYYFMCTCFYKISPPEAEISTSNCELVSLQMIEQPIAGNVISKSLVCKSNALLLSHSDRWLLGDILTGSTFDFLKIHVLVIKRSNGATFLLQEIIVNN